MQISNKAIERIAQLLMGQDLESAAKVHQPQAASKTSNDRVTLTVQTKGLQSFRDIVSDASEIRWDRVNELKQAIQSGTYRVPAEAIADKMLAEGKDV